MKPFSTSRSFRLSTGNMYFFSFSWKGNEEQVTHLLQGHLCCASMEHQQQAPMSTEAFSDPSPLFPWVLFPDCEKSGKKSLSFPTAFVMWPNIPVPLTPPGPGTSTAMSNFPRLRSALQSNSSQQMGQSRFRKRQACNREAGLIQKLSINLDVKYDVKDLVYIFLSQIYLLRKLNLLILWLPPIPVLVIHSISYCEPFTFIKNKNIKTWS